MAKCPRCDQRVDSQAVACPYCKFDLKAFGHRGIPLHRARSDTYLCHSCLYDHDDTCNFPQRPLAKDCILYQNQAEPVVPSDAISRPSLGTTITQWCRQHVAGLVLAGVLLVSLLLSLF
ncbi:MAG: zinc ribbon domain-containing protein [Microcoleaceae cyanobacterium]